MNNLLSSYRVDFTLPINRYISILLIIVITGLTIYSIKNLLFNLNLRRRIVLATMRILAVITFLLIFLQPSVMKTTYLLEKEPIAILVDASRSMLLKCGDSNRLKKAADLADQILKDPKIAEEHNILLYTFSKNIYPTGTPSEIGVINEDSTDILTSLQNLRIKQPGLSNIILISDGADTNILRMQKTSATDFMKRFLKNLNIPVFTILVGAEESISDTSVRVVSASPVGFYGKAFEIIVEITNNQKDTDSIPLNISENNSPIFSNRYRVPPGEKKQFKISIYPKNIGRNVYEVSIPPIGKEEFTHNNQDYFISRITKESLRILQISGSVSYDVRFLRQTLKKDPAIDLISFFILRTLASDVNAPDSELSLIPFPADNIIRENLFSFDIIIFQDFGFIPYGLNTTFTDINRFIKNGGALLFITGNSWYKWIGNYLSFFSDCMPATPRIDDDAIKNIIYKPELTAEGKTHPITRILNEFEENLLLYKNTPEFHGVHLLSDIKPDASSLLSARIDEYKNEPLLLVRRCENGRTALLTTDELWRFSFSEKTPDEFNLYNKIINNLLLWLSGEPNKEELLISQGSSPGRLTRLTGRFSGPIGQNSIQLQIDDGRQINGKIQNDGEFAFDISGLKEGMYSAKIIYQGAVYNTFFYKKNTDPENEDISIYPEILKKIARYSGGGYIEAEDIGKRDIPLVKRPIKKIQNQTSMPLFNRTWSLLIFIALFSIEWFFRRMYGHQ